MIENGRAQGTISAHVHYELFAGPPSWLRAAPRPEVLPIPAKFSFDLSSSWAKFVFNSMMIGRALPLSKLEAWRQ